MGGRLRTRTARGWGEASCHVALCSHVCAMGAGLAVQGATHPRALLSGGIRAAGELVLTVRTDFVLRKPYFARVFVAGKLCAFVLGKTISLKEKLTSYLETQNLRVPVGLPRAGGVRLPTLQLTLPEGAGVQGTARLSARGISSALGAPLRLPRAPEVKAVHSGFGAGHRSDDRLRLRAWSVSRPPDTLPAPPRQLGRLLPQTVVNPPILWRQPRKTTLL